MCFSFFLPFFLSYSLSFSLSFSVLLSSHLSVTPPLSFFSCLFLNFFAMPLHSLISHTKDSLFSSSVPFFLFFSLSTSPSFPLPSFFLSLCMLCSFVWHYVSISALSASLFLFLPPCLPPSLPPHAASQWLKGGKDGTSQAAVSHSARLLVLRTAACRPVRWPRGTRQPPDETPRSNYLFYTKTDLKLWPSAVAFPLLTHTHTHPVASSHPHTSAHAAGCRLHCQPAPLLFIKTFRSCCCCCCWICFLLGLNSRTKH